MSVLIISHAYARQGIAEIMLSVNGEPYLREPPSTPGASFIQITLEWLPKAPGEYILEVRVYDTKGQSTQAVVRVRAVGPVTSPVPSTPTSAPTIPPTPTSTAIPPTPTATATATVTPPPAQVNFWVERNTLTLGECTTLHWDVEYATAVSLNGEGVAAHGTRQVCPSSTTTYYLHVVSPAGDVDRSVTVEVAAPPDTTPPSITKIKESDDPIYSHSQCGANVVTITAWVNDPSGIAKVELNYRVVRGADYGQWRTLSMTPAGTGKYQITINWDEWKNSLNPPVYSTATVEYYIRAWDTKNNLAQSGLTTLTLKICLL
ncbi:MAG: hypothetical protein ACK4VW_02105 [Anaerolineales bacterium]